jgi:hypothetical protein
MADDDDRKFDDLRDLADLAEVACERIRQSVGIIARIYEGGEDSDRGILVSPRVVTLALAELAGEIPELTPREAPSRSNCCMTKTPALARACRKTKPPAPSVLSMVRITGRDGCGRWMPRSTTSRAISTGRCGCSG